MAKYSKIYRKIIAFPELEAFYDALLDRLFMVTQEFFHIEKTFTVYINCIARNHPPGTIKKVERVQNFELVYGGIKRQKALLEHETGKKIPKLNDAWDSLARTLTYGSELDFQGGVISQGLHLEFVKNELDLSDLQVKGSGKLTDYFDDVINHLGRPKGHYREQEYAILNAYFQLEDYRYLSLPLIQFAELDGWVYIVYHEQDHYRFFRKEENSEDEKLRSRIIGDLIKAYSREYEALILSWELVSESEKQRVINEELQKVLQPGFYKKSALNKILMELKYPEYYERYREYFTLRNRLGHAEDVRRAKRARRNAVLTILMDSYAHNISAHSLVTLANWFDQRAVFFDYEEGKRVRHDFKTVPSKLPFITKNYNYNHDIHALMRFLLYKGAFWGGLIRDKSQGGVTLNLYDMLWGNFMQNPLFLGTIAYTEGILKLQLSVTILGLERVDSLGLVLEKKILADEVLGKIDLSRWIEEPGAENLSGFLQKGTGHDVLKGYLESFKVFLPGGIVGEQAFYTILENELRNVKHYTPEVITEMQTEGLCLNISIEGNHYTGAHTDPTKKPPYYKIGVWLKHPVLITPELIKKRLKNLDSDIIFKDYRAKLGGIYQDKICAAMLFNNTFSSVQNEASERDKYFYPWIWVGFSSDKKGVEGMEQRDIEVSARAFRKNAVKKNFNTIFQGERGYYKKFFHLWLGEDVAYDGSTIFSESSWENISRFRFVCLRNEQFAERKQLQGRGIIRIVPTTCRSIEDAYSAWLEHWIVKKTPRHPAIWFYMKGELLAELYWDGQKIVYHGLNHKSGKQSSLDTHEVRKIKLAHGYQDGTGEEMAFRNDGVLKQMLLGGQQFDVAKMPDAVAAELFETVETQICIFDNRIAQECMNYGISMPEMNAIGCKVFQESELEWNKLVKQKDWMVQCHFLVLHLSFVQGFIGKNKQRYSEDNIHLFIEQEILSGKKRPPHFFVILVTGRGRTKWQNTLKEQNQTKDYSFVMFRPIEAFISVVSDTLSKNDYFDLKYYICKILFGS